MKKPKARTRTSVGLHPEKTETEKRHVGRPTDYREEYAELGRRFCLLKGATDEELAQFFGVVVRTIQYWKEAHPEFLHSLNEGKEKADANVAASLYERACGYSHPDVHVSNYQGDITLTPLTKHYPPDTAAAFIWLKNRAGWKDRIEHTGKDGESLPAPVINVLPPSHAK